MFGCLDVWMLGCLPRINEWTKGIQIWCSFVLFNINAYISITRLSFVFLLYRKGSGVSKFFIHLYICFLIGFFHVDRYGTCIEYVPHTLLIKSQSLLLCIVAIRSPTISVQSVHMRVNPTFPKITIFAFVFFCIGANLFRTIRIQRKGSECLLDVIV